MADQKIELVNAMLSQFEAYAGGSWIAAGGDNGPKYLCRVISMSDALQIICYDQIACDDYAKRRGKISKTHDVAVLDAAAKMTKNMPEPVYVIKNVNGSHATDLDHFHGFIIETYGDLWEQMKNMK